MARELRSQIAVTTAVMVLIAGLMALDAGTAIGGNSRDAQFNSHAGGSSPTVTNGAGVGAPAGAGAPAGVGNSGHVESGSKTAGSSPVTSVAGGSATTTGRANATGGNTRHVEFGSPAAGSSLTFTDVTAGGATAVDVVLRNLGPQMLTHVRLSGGVEAPTSFNPRSAPPFCTVTGGTVNCPASLPSGSHYLAVYVSSTSTGAATCSLTHPAVTGFDGLVCSVGKLGAGQFVQLRVVISPPSTPGSVPLWLAAQLDEGSSNKGSNTDLFTAAGSVNVQAPTCTLAATYFVSTSAVSLTNDPGTLGCSQKTTIQGPSFSQRGAFARLLFDPGSTQCPTSFVCIGGLSIASVNDGVAGSDAIVWTIRWDSSLYDDPPTGVIHFLDTYNSVTAPTDFVEIDFHAAHQCPTPTSGTNCWTVYNVQPTFTEASFRTPTNGSAKGF